MYFFDIDNRGIVTQLSELAGGFSPLGLNVVYAKDRIEAFALYQEWRHGCSYLRRDLYLSDRSSPVKNVIHR